MKSRGTAAVRHKTFNSGKIAVVGYGNWGVSLVQGLSSSGLGPREIILRTGARARKSLTHPRIAEIPAQQLKNAQLDEEIFWLCVPDASIEIATRQIVKELQRRSTSAKPSSLKGRLFIHSSGVFSVDVLQSAFDAGAAVAAVHPLMTFPSRNPVALKGVPFAVEATGGFRRMLNVLIQKMGGEPFQISPGGKIFYHAAAVMASPLMASLIAATQETAALAGLTATQTRQLFHPIARATVENLYTRGKKNSLSGPVARGDETAIRLHLQVLTAHPMLAEIYKSLAMYASSSFSVRRKAEVQRMLTSAGRKSAETHLRSYR